MCFPGAKELCERPQYNHSGTIFRTKIWCMQVLQIEEKNYEQGANLDRVCGIRDLGSNWTNQAELAPIWQASSDSGHSNSPNVGMSVARMSSNMALMWAGQPCGEMSCKCEEGDQMITKPLRLEAVWKISRNLSSLFLAQDFGFWRLK